MGGPSVSAGRRIRRMSRLHLMTASSRMPLEMIMTQNFSPSTRKSRFAYRLLVLNHIIRLIKDQSSEKILQEEPRNK